MKRPLRLAAWFLFFAAAATLLPCTLGCTPNVEPSSDALLPPPDASARQDVAESDPLPRLERMVGAEWWWQNPREEVFLEDYVECLWGPLTWRPRTYPKTYEPMWDRQLKAKCLFLLTVDAGWRCLPSLPQINPPGLALDGFYAADKTCGLYTNWRFALPENDDHRYLVLYDIDAAAYRVFEAVPETGSVVKAEFIPPVRGCTQARAQTLRTFARGKRFTPMRLSRLHHHSFALNV